MNNFDPSEHEFRIGDLALSRRRLLQKAGMGMGSLSLAMLLSNAMASSARADAAVNPLAPKNPPLPAKAKHVIHIFAAGGPSHVDTWDYKPALAKYADQQLPGLGGLSFPSPYKFAKKGKSGLEVSDVFPHLGDCVDDMTVIKSLYTDVPDHGIASRFMHTGSLQIPKPSMGSWVVYGLGTENQNLPGFISIGGDAEARQASFLPSVYQGVGVNYSRGAPLDQILLNIRSPFTTLDDQRYQIALARELDKIHAEKLHKDDQLETRIESFEMAFKMQTEATDAFDIMKEPEAVRKAYGETDTGARMLVARRLVERGVRFVQVFAGGWDHHSQLEVQLKRRAEDIDQPAAALIQDLKQRGLLESTLIIWGGEFGRTVTVDTREATPGRNHNGKGFCCWMAGGGVKGGMSYGQTDEFGDRAEINRVHIHDLHATVMALLGFDHKKLTYRYNGRDFRLTDNYGDVVRDIIA
jgi:hypothetical protein